MKLKIFGVACTNFLEILKIAGSRSKFLDFDFEIQNLRWPLIKKYYKSDPTYNLKVMGVTNAAKISNGLYSSVKSAFYQLGDSSSLWRPLDDLGSKNLILRWVFLYSECLTLKLENPKFSRIFYLSYGKNSKFWRVNLSLQKYTFCKNWTKIMGQSWFGARIYPRGLSLGE